MGEAAHAASPVAITSTGLGNCRGLVVSGGRGGPGLFACSDLGGLHAVTLKCPRPQRGRASLKSRESYNAL